MAGLFLALGPFVSAPMARAESPPLISVPVDSYRDQPAGIRYGGLLYHASVVSGTVWDSNVFSSKENVVGDRIDFVRPGLTVSTLDPNYKFVFRTALDHLEYHNAPEEGRTDAVAELKGTVRLQRDLDLLVGAVAARIHEPRSIERRDLPDTAAEPPLHNQYSAWVGLRKNFNSWVSTTTVIYGNDNYFDVRSTSGTSLNLQYLDRDSVTVAHEAERRVSQRLLLFSQQRVIMTNYRDVPGFEQRDSTKFVAVNGIEVALTPLIVGRFSFRYADEHFKSAAYEAEPELNYIAEVTWTPRRYLSFKAGLAREFGGINFDLASVGGRRTRGTLAVTYDITRQLFFRASLDYLHANEGSTTGGGRLEDTYLYKASLGYEMNRFWSLFFDYAYQRRESNSDLSEFQRHIIQGGVVGRF